MCPARSGQQDGEVDARATPAVDLRPIHWPDVPPFIIAELSGNHNQGLDRAKRLIDACAGAGAGAHLVKLQTYTPDTITIDHDGPGFRLQSGLWADKTLHQLYGEGFTPYEWRPILSSPFDDTAVDLLESLDAPGFKIASFEAIDLPLINRACRKGRPLIISTGMTSPQEIADAVDIVLLHCLSSYPATFADANLWAILRETLAADGVRSIRPGFGLAPRHLPHALGRKAARSLKRGEPLSWDMLS